ncbi:hypothetical protein [Hydrogenophaga sp.]|uniref:YciI family protein n=1 Tax=Hydrogenophaga sp. TaxID=1904254 RepID=UPI00260C5E85|nr:hypothetical protein [Hydrogenophaga sp.]MCW5653593.1 hypothetical protein [Hydrogenophaga sp.]
MHIVLLRFSHNKAAAPQHMAGHKDWLQRGFDDGSFLLSGSLAGGQGGMVLAAPGVAPAALAERVQQDPFVSEQVVSAEIISVAPHRADERLRCLMAEEGARTA